MNNDSISESDGGKIVISLTKDDLSDIAACIELVCCNANPSRRSVMDYSAMMSRLTGLRSKIEHIADFADTVHIVRGEESAHVR